MEYGTNKARSVGENARLDLLPNPMTPNPVPPNILATRINRAVRDNALATLAQLLAMPEAPAAIATHGRTLANAWELPLVYAAETGNVDAVKHLLAAGADLEASYEDGTPALFSALWMRQLACAEVLLEAGADVGYKSKAGTRLFDAALRTGDGDWIARFAKSAALDYANSKKVTALHFACHGGNREWIDRILAETKLTASAKTQSGQRPMDYCKHVETWDYLRGIAPKIAINPSFSTGYDAFWLMADKGAADIVQRFIAAGEKVDNTYSSTQRNMLVHAAARSGSVETMKALVAGGAKVNARNAYNFRPLHWAVQCNHLAMVQALLQLGAKPNVKTNSTFIIQETRTPLYFAAEVGNADIAQALLNAGADANDLCDSSNATALTEAASWNELAVARVLLAGGASPNGVNRSGSGVDYYYFPLARACSAEMVTLLIDAGAQVNARNQHGETALKSLAQVEAPSDEEIAALAALLAAGADPHEADMHGMTALSWAKSVRITEMLGAAMRGQNPVAERTGEVAKAEQEQSAYRRGINTVAELMTGRKARQPPRQPAATPGIGKALYERAHDAAYEPSNLKSFAALLAQATREDVRYVSDDSYNDNESLLHRLAHEVGQAMGKPECMALIKPVIAKVVEIGADVNALDDEGRTPLHTLLYATAYRDWTKTIAKDVVEIATALIDSGANINARNQAGSTPLDEVGHPDVAAALMARGAEWAGFPSGCWHALEYDARWGHVEQMAKMGAKLAAPDGLGTNLLTRVASAAEVAQYDKLVALGAHWVKPHKGYDTPLLAAAAAGNAALVMHLAPLHAAHIDHRGNAGRTALVAMAVWIGDCPKDKRGPAIEAACELARCGADLNAKDDYGAIAIDTLPSKVIREKVQKAARR
jgi:uncharacterized protein